MSADGCSLGVHSYCCGVIVEKVSGSEVEAVSERPISRLDALGDSSMPC